MRILSVIFLFLSLAVGAQAKSTVPKHFSENWIELSENKSGSLFFIDEDSIKKINKKESIVQFSLLILKSNKDLKSVMEIDCDKQTVRSGPEYQYKKSGSLLIKFDDWEKESSVIKEGTVFEVVKNYVCTP